MPTRTLVAAMTPSASNRTGSASDRACRFRSARLGPALALGVLIEVLTLLAPPVWAQLVSVQCCTEQPDLDRIGECVSGPGGTTRPASCPPAATCVLGFGDDVVLMASLCDPEQVVPPTPFRAYCSEWADETATVVKECVAKSNASINLFTVYDDDQDGDLDLKDLAVFTQVYDSVPKLEQSDAVVVAVECCVPESIVRRIGECLSGPGGMSIPSACTGTATCVVGFSALVEVGDWQYKLCTTGPVELPDASTSFCVSWQTESMPIAHSCRGSHIAGNYFFVVSDTDGDGDVDLADYAVIQREFGQAATE